jgi:hypothetical protein
METACEDAAEMPPAAAKTAFANRPDRFRRITGADVFADCLHLYNANGDVFVLRGLGSSPRPTRASRVTVDVLTSAGFGRIIDSAGHSLRSMIELGCCGAGNLSFSEFDGDFLVARHPN